MEELNHAETASMCWRLCTAYHAGGAKQYSSYAAEGLAVRHLRQDLRPLRAPLPLPLPFQPTFSSSSSIRSLACCRAAPRSSDTAWGRKTSTMKMTHGLCQRRNMPCPHAPSLPACCAMQPDRIVYCASTRVQHEQVDPTPWSWWLASLTNNTHPTGRVHVHACPMPPHRDPHHLQCLDPGLPQHLSHPHVMGQPLIT